MVSSPSPEHCSTNTDQDFQVRIRCVDSACKDYDLCVPCFAAGEHSRNHKPASHSYQVVEQHAVPIFTDDWGADEEELLLEGAETYGLGSWADIADHIGGFRDKDEVRDHYINTYVNSSKFPLPEHASPADDSLPNVTPRAEFQARKKQRIEDRKDTLKNAPPAPPKQKPVSSVPSCHEVQGFMPGRLEFEAEHHNEAEEAIQAMQFEPGEGYNEETGEVEPEMELKLTIFDVYNNRLTARVERKRFIFEHQLLEYRRNIAAERKKTKEERDLFNRARPLARVMLKPDFDDFTQGLEYELNLRQAIAQLQEWRQMKIGDLRAGERYEIEKAARLARVAAQNSYDRFATSRPPKATAHTAEINPVTSSLTAPDLELKPPNGLATPPQSVSPSAVAGSAERPVKMKGESNGTHINGNGVSLAQRPKFSMAPLSNVNPLKLNENTADIHLLNSDERDLCSQLRIMPRSYTAMKDSVLREAEKHGGAIKKKAAREICKIDGGKTSRMFDFFVNSGWIAKA